ncbi:MAG TPA: YkvA family protein [Streptosporangiaceae bacterium]|nr:YkvA family protein [Streptosporangiaceae bacterium]
MSDIGWDFIGSLGVFALLFLIVTLGIVLFVVIKLVRRYRQINQPGMPRSPKVVFWGSILYTISPIDLVPDPVYLDDLGVNMAALIYIGHMISRFQQSIAHNKRRIDPPRQLD